MQCDDDFSSAGELAVGLVLDVFSPDPGGPRLVRLKKTPTTELDVIDGNT